MRLRKVSLIFILVLLLAGYLGAQPATYGAIDLGSKGTKAALYSFVRDKGELTAKPLMSDTVNTKLVSSMNGTRFTAEGINDAIDATQSLLEKMQTAARKNKLANVKYYIVGSSGVSKGENKDELAAAVKKATGIDMDYIDARREGYLALLSSIPRIDRSTAILVDIGSGNTKLGCIVGESNEKSFKSAEIPYGSVTGRKAALKLNSADIRAGIGQIMRDEVRPSYAKESMDIPCLRNRRSIYWTGGAAWATATMIHPERALYENARIARGDIDTFLARLFDGTWNQLDLKYKFPKGTSRDWQIKTRARAEAEKNDLMSTFIAEDIMSGVSIMKTILDVSNPSAEIFFARNGYYINSYVLEKYTEDQEVVASKK
jgi:exopolyphosphatase/pppGpp-phosphohydrolase